MLNIFTLSHGRLYQEEISSWDALTHAQPVWVDLENPSALERHWIAQRFDLHIPENAVAENIEESARFFEEDNGEIHIRADFLADVSEDASRSMRAAFILNLTNDALRSKGILFSVHDESIPAFRLLRLRARRIPGLTSDAREVLLGLFDGDVEYSADALEGAQDALEEVSRRVLRGHVSDEVANEVLATIARQEHLNGMIRRSAMDTRRALSFMMRTKMLSAVQLDDARQTARDIESLEGHTIFIFDKINFLMDATVGFININQNKIIKLFSVASVALLPPTLIASIYGMNFQHMPELNHKLGYPFALILMLLSALVPMWYFRRKGWLK